MSIPFEIFFIFLFFTESFKNLLKAQVKSTFWKKQAKIGIKHKIVICVLITYSDILNFSSAFSFSILC